MHYISSGFTPCCAELVSFSAIRVFDAHTATTKRANDDYGLGYLAPFTKEKWEEWRRKYSLQSGIDYNIETGKQTNSKEHGVAYSNGSKITLHTISNPHNCTTATEPCK